MKFLFDARYIRTDFHDGVSRYSTELAGQIVNFIDTTFIICDPAQLAFLPEESKYIQIHGPTSPKEPLTAFVLNKYQPDVVYTPMQTMGSLGRKYKLILTLQDIIYYKFPSAPTFLPPHIRGIWWLFHQAYWPQRLLLKGASAVATVSQTSKKYIERYNLAQNVIVVSNAPPTQNYPVAAATPAKSIVYMGSFMKYKNVETLIEGMRYIPDDFTLHLLSRISDERLAELQKFVPSGTNVVFHRGVSDEEYYELLKNAWALVTASKIEGFGLPVVEAGIIGVPVVISDTDVFHEAGGDDALFFDPESPEEFAKQVMMLADPAIRAQKIAAGKINAATFSWVKSASELKKLIESLQMTMPPNESEGISTLQ